MPDLLNVTIITLLNPGQCIETKSKGKQKQRKSLIKANLELTMINLLAYSQHFYACKTLRSYYLYHVNFPKAQF